jgi:hypothetical protein
MALVSFSVAAPQPLDANGIDVAAGLAQQLVSEETSAHADL